jgi:hypothetical protein
MIGLTLTEIRPNNDPLRMASLNENYKIDQFYRDRNNKMRNFGCNGGVTVKNEKY